MSTTRPQRNRPRHGKLPQISTFASPIVENLPYPVAHYPSAYGTFITFSETATSPLTLCTCTEAAIDNVQRFLHLNKEGWRYPELSILGSIDGGIPVTIRYAKGICHRCNLKTPSLRYCHEMYGGRFVQTYGWYINQAHLALGILPRSTIYLSDICPPEFQELIIDSAQATNSYVKEQDKLNQMRIDEQELLNAVQSGTANDLQPAAQESEWLRTLTEQATLVAELRRTAAQKMRSYTRQVENFVRKDFGIRNVGEGWVSETMLYQIIRNLYPEHNVLFHNRPEWLEKLELDVYIPDLYLAFEYQGAQHFHPIQLWGGEQALNTVREHDNRKAMLCRQQKVKLVTVDYTEPLTEKHITELINKSIQCKT